LRRWSTTLSKSIKNKDYFEYLPSPAIACDKTGNIINFNQRAKKIIPEIETEKNINQWIDQLKLQENNIKNFLEIFNFVKSQSESHQIFNIPILQDKGLSFEFHFGFINEEEVILELLNTTDLYRNIITLEYKESISDNVISHVNESIIGFTKTGAIEYLSPAAERLFLTTLEESYFEDIFFLFEESNHERVREIIEQLGQSNSEHVEDINCIDSNKRSFPASTTWWKSVTKKIDMHFVHILDLTFLKTFMNDINSAFIRADHQSIIVDANVMACEVFYREKEDLIGKPVSFLKIMHTADKNHLINPKELMELEADETLTIQSPLKGQKFYTANTWPQETVAGRIYNIVLHDITEKKNQEKVLYDSAYTDSLTNLSNRLHLMKILEEKINSEKNKDSTFSLMLLDLDGFKLINDSYGHHYGDELLKVVSEKLKECVRKVDIVARLGGDEFIILLENMSSQEELENIAHRILMALRRKELILNQELSVSSSIGIVKYPEISSDKDELLKFADIAMYTAKHKGKDNFVFFSKKIFEQQKRTNEIKENLKQALTQNEFRLVFQPKVIAPEMQIYGLEALIRWNSPKIGAIYPDEFISLAEKTGDIYDIDRWVIREAIKQWEDWTNHNLIFKKYMTNLSINVSALHINEELCSFLKDTIATHSIDPKTLEIEITESALVKDVLETSQIINQMKQLGIQVSIDDFGVGYSSLKYLKDLPLDTIKIDRSFISDINVIDKNSFVVEAIIAIGEKLGFRIIAEGVETKDDLSRLINMGCYNFQGYFFSRPLEIEQIMPFVNDNIAKISQ